MYEGKSRREVEVTEQQPNQILIKYRIDNILKSDNTPYQEIKDMDRISDFLGTFSSDSTRRAYRTDLQKFVQFLDQDASDLQFSEVQSAQVQEFLDAMQREELSISTRRRRLSAVRRFYDWMIDGGIVQQNPARGPNVTLRRPDEEPSTLRFLSKEDVEAVVNRAGTMPTVGARDQALVLVIVYGSLRRSEVASLNIGHVRPLGRQPCREPLIYTKPTTGRFGAHSVIGTGAVV